MLFRFIAVFFIGGLCLSSSVVGAPIDILCFGQPASEEAHHLKAQASDTITGGLGEPARRLLPVDPADWKGGEMSFVLKVDPEKPNYITVRFWGDDITADRLFLFCEGRQIGYRHLGDIDQLDFGSDEPVYNGRFYYTTTPLPLEMTKGRTGLAFAIHSSGRIWGYGQTFDKYQKPMTDPTRGIYRIYSHTDGFFAPPADEPQGAAVVDAPVRKEPGVEVLDKLKERVNHELDGELRSVRPLNQMQAFFLARAYGVTWTHAWKNPKALEQILKSLDATFAAYLKNPKLAQSDPATPNADWFGLGPSGAVIHLLAGPLESALDDKLDDGKGGLITRREAYAGMLVACRDWHRAHRRLYTNQSMINDLYGIYLANRGIEVVAPDKALSEEEARRYLYESVGLQPWLGNDTPAGPARPQDGGYYQTTAKGLTRELGYVGSYGEVLDWVNGIYDATRPEPGRPGDEKIRAQLAKLAKARACFRYPALDADGNRVMRLETVVGWRDSHLPGEVDYGQRASRDASPLQTALNTLDPDSIGYARQMLADNQFFQATDHAMNEGGLRVTAGLLETPGQYEALLALPPSGKRLPMTRGQPDFVFSDEEDGVVALKHGDEILYASLYWRARYAVNFLARVHYLTPRYSRIAVVREETEFEPGGMTYTRPDWTNMAFGNGGVRYPGVEHSAHAGEVLPIAKIPAGVAFRPGQESVYAGKGSFYTLRYGDYLIGMNMTTDRTFTLKTPEGVSSAPDLVSGKKLSLGEPVPVGPRSTVVLWLGQ